MLDDLKERVTGLLARVELQAEQPPAPRPQAAMVESHADASMRMDEPMYEMAGAEQGRMTAMPARADAVNPNDPATWHNSSRNALCPCGSGKKFKHCHGRTM